MSGTPEERASLETRAKADVDSSGFKIDFSRTESIRSWCESAATTLDMNTDGRKLAQSAYLEVLQKPDATPGQIIAATNKFVTDYEGGDKSLEQKPGLVEKLRSVVDGTAAHYNLDPRSGDPSTKATDFVTSVASKFGSYTPHEPAAVPGAGGAGASAPARDEQLENFPGAVRDALKQQQVLYGPKNK